MRERRRGEKEGEYREGGGREEETSKLPPLDRRIQQLLGGPCSST